MNSKVIFSNNVGLELKKLIDELKPDKVFSLSDPDVHCFVFTLIELNSDNKVDLEKYYIETFQGEKHKTISAVEDIWRDLCSENATRSSLLVNIGGGVITDMGGFAASTFKRGIRFINIPTTLLAAVDASVGGKTGVNLYGYKNEIGTFTEPVATIVSSTFLSTLPIEELYSGYGEMLKHGLLDSQEHLSLLYNTDIDNIDNDSCLELIKKSVSVKQRFVKADFHESGIRKALNLGHTVGHALEEFFLKKQENLPHGYAVAHGCVVALVLSHLKLGFPSTTLHTFANYVREKFEAPGFNCNNYPTLLELMHHDKKNDSDEFFNFTLLHDVGKVEVNVKISEDDLRNALDIYRDLMGI